MSDFHCRHCGFDLDGGDVYEVLRGMKYYKDKSDEEVLVCASNYGYTTENRKRFNKVIVLQPTNEEICKACRQRWPLPKDSGPLNQT
jgi:hypothetical protein